jgi:hypothetical protein
MYADQSCVGAIGTVSVATRGAEGPGEVLLKLAGGTEAYIAWSERPLARGEGIIVYNSRGGRTVDVMEFTA